MGRGETAKWLGNPPSWLLDFPKFYRPVPWRCCRKEKNHQSFPSFPLALLACPKHSRVSLVTSAPNQALASLKEAKVLNLPYCGQSTLSKPNLSEYQSQYYFAYLLFVPMTWLPNLIPRNKFQFFAFVFGSCWSDAIRCAVSLVGGVWPKRRANFCAKIPFLWPDWWRGTTV